jgi:cytochrome b561
MVVKKTPHSNGEAMHTRSVARYSPMAQTLHWLTAILVLIAFIYSPGGSEERVYAAARDAQRQLHESLGLTVLALTLIRVLWRAVDNRPDPPDVVRWMGITSKVVQGLLFALLFAIPLTAIIGAWLEGHPLTLLGGIRIASPMARSHAGGAVIAEIHTWLGDAILWIAGLHALAALFHHYVIRDNVLISMLPRWIPLGRKK